MEKDSQLPGQLIKLTYEGLPLEFPEWDDLYVVGTIPPGIWDTIRQRHQDFMRDPDWMIDELTQITIDSLRAAGCQVFTFSGSSEFTALPGDFPEEDKDILCDWCRCSIPYGDQIVTSNATGDARFCTESCLLEALTQKCDGEVKVIEEVDGNDDDPLLECPHCHKRSYGTSDKWSSEGMFTIPGENGCEFSIMTCPRCGEPTPMIERVLIDANDPRLKEDSFGAGERQRQERKFSPRRE